MSGVDASLDPVVVWGAGAMGGSIGASLLRAGHGVLFVDADPVHAEAIRSAGLQISGPVDAFTVAADCISPEEVGGPLGTVLLCVKAHHTEAASRRIATLLARDGFVVSVQNGLNEETIARHVGQRRTMGCFVNFGADVVAPGSVMRGNRGAVVVGELDGRVTPRLRAVHRLFRDFEPDAIRSRNIQGYLWAKLAYGSMLFATALSDSSIADVLDDPAHRPALIGLAREAVAVAVATGVEPEPFDGFDPFAFGPEAPGRHAEASLDRLVAFNRSSAKSHSGVWRDLAVRKRKTEVDAQIVPVVERGRSAGVDTPLTQRLVALIHDVEEGRRVQSRETLDALTG